jgi:hypothetical protein
MKHRVSLAVNGESKASPQTIYTLEKPPKVVNRPSEKAKKKIKGLLTN